MRYDFLVDTYRTERLKTLSVWSEVPDARMRDRSEPRARSPLDHMVHQCVSEDGWTTSMFGIAVSRPVLPAEETRLAFLEHYAAVSAERLAALRAMPESWFEETVQFFEVPRPRAWALVRRFTHSAHHRGQLTELLRSWGQPLYSTYGPTADTGGLPKSGATVLYRYGSVEDLLEGEMQGRVTPPLPGTGSASPTERPGDV
jgi:uncharacterized damage-inducible protein DinB